MKTFRLRRLEQNERVTLGHLVDETEQFICCCTLELPDRDNHPQTSCIPAGRYRCTLTYSPHFGRTLFEVFGVPGRSSIRIHAANYTRELLGCIATGKSFADIDHDGVKDVASSVVALAAFMATAGTDDFWLEVIDVDGAKKVAA
jgi:hypothetical protein